MRNTVPSSRSGNYKYERNGSEVAINETFTRVRKDDALRHTFARRVTPQGVTLEVNAVETLGELSWQVRSANIDMQSASSSISTTWEHAGELLRFSRRMVRSDVDAVQAESEAITVGDAALLSPLLRIFQGDVIRELALRGGSHPTVVPWILDPAKTDELLRPTIELRSASKVAPNAYVYTAGVYDADDRFIVDDDGTLSSYRFRSPDGAQWTIARTDDVT